MKRDPVNRARRQTCLILVGGLLFQCVALVSICAQDESEKFGGDDGGFGGGENVSPKLSPEDERSIARLSARLEARLVTKYFPSKLDGKRIVHLSELSEEQLAGDLNAAKEKQAKIREQLKSLKELEAVRDSVKNKESEFDYKGPSYQEAAREYLRSRLGELVSLEHAVSDIEFRCLFYVENCDEGNVRSSLETLKRLIRIQEDGLKDLAALISEIPELKDDDYEWARKQYSRALADSRKLPGQIESSFKSKCEKLEKPEKEKPKESNSPKKPETTQQSGKRPTFGFGDDTFVIPEDLDPYQIEKDLQMEPVPEKKDGLTPGRNSEPKDFGTVDKWGNENIEGLNGTWYSKTHKATFEIHVKGNRVYLGIRSFPGYPDRIYKGELKKNKGALFFQPREVGFAEIPVKVQKKLISQAYTMRIGLSYDWSLNGSVQNVYLHWPEDFFEWDPGKSLTRKTLNYRLHHHLLERGR